MLFKNIFWQPKVRKMANSKLGKHFLQFPFYECESTKFVSDRKLLACILAVKIPVHVFQWMIALFMPGLVCRRIVQDAWISPGRVD